MRGREGKGEDERGGTGPYLKGVYGFTSTPSRNVEKKNFWQCKKARPAKCRG